MTPPNAAGADRHPHLAEPLPSGWVRVDMHAHTMWSGDSTTTPEELERGVEESGIDVLCLTDHNSVQAAPELGDRLGCRLVVGEEVRTQRGEIIGLFLAERVPSGLSPREVAGRIRDQGGVVYIPHPFDPMRARLAEAAIDDLADLGLIDAIEVRNAKTSLSSLNDRARTYATERGLAHGAGSDAHVPDAIGAACVEMPDFDGPADFLEALRRGRVVGHHFDPPRSWEPRIVPSTG